MSGEKDWLKVAIIILDWNGWRYDWGLSASERRGN